MRKPVAGAPQAPSSAIQRRIIVAACPKAGGMRVRSAIATHPAVYDPGETGLFDEVLHDGNRGARERAPVPADDGVAQPAPFAARIRLRTSLRARVAELDRRALAAGCRNWIERMAVPAGGIRSLQRLIERVRVIHVIRDGRDVVAARCRHMAGMRGGSCRYADAHRAVAEWNRSIAWHERAVGRRGHLFTLFEDWASEPERETRRLVRACGLPDEIDHGIDLSQTGSVPWIRAERDQLRQLFDYKKRRRIESALDLQRYGRLAERLRGSRLVKAPLPETMLVPPPRHAVTQPQDAQKGHSDSR